jgi:hypothetical protein
MVASVHVLHASSKILTSILLRNEVGNWLTCRTYPNFGGQSICC